MTDYFFLFTCLICIVWFLTFNGTRSCVSPPPRPAGLSRFGSPLPGRLTFCNEMSFLQQEGHYHSASLHSSVRRWCTGCELLWAGATYEYIWKKKGQHTGRMKGGLFCKRVVPDPATRSEGSKSSISPAPSEWWVAGRQPARWTSQQQVIKLVLQGFHRRRIPALWNSKSW